MMSNGFGMDGLSGIGMLVFVVLVLLGVVILIHWFSDDSTVNDKHSALEIARLRFANQEITLEEFETIQNGLTS